MTKRHTELAHAALFVLPVLVLVGIMIVYPALETLRLSFYDAQGNFVGFGNFAAILSHSDTLNLDRFPETYPPWGSLIHNAVWILIHLPVTVGLGIVLAALLHDLRGGPAIKGIIFLGVVLPMIVGGVLIRFVFDAGAGIVPNLLEAIGYEGVVTRSWTAYPQTSLLSLILGSILLWTGFSLTLHASGLSSIPRELYEAADVDGAGVWVKFVRITVPLLAPVTTVVIAMTLLWEIKIFDIVFAATGGGPGGSSMVLSLQMYIYAFRALEQNMAATVGVLLGVFTGIVGIWLMRRNAREVHS